VRITYPARPLAGPEKVGDIVPEPLSKKGDSAQSALDALQRIVNCIDACTKKKGSHSGAFFNSSIQDIEVFANVADDMAKHAAKNGQPITAQQAKHISVATKRLRKRLLKQKTTPKFEELKTSQLYKRIVTLIAEIEQQVAEWKVGEK
jgi:chemotaxis regulatin CheY-phosphate phosphatase CheZ